MKGSARLHKMVVITVAACIAHYLFCHLNSEADHNFRANLYVIMECLTTIIDLVLVFLG